MANRYPRVDIFTTALRHTNTGPEPADTTVLFAPIGSEFGPTDEIKRLHSLSDLISTYGDLSYEKMGQTALNVYQWLRAGGTVYAYRLTDSTKKTATYSDMITAKYPGTYYNNIEITITSRNPKPESPRNDLDDSTKYNTRFDLIVRHKEINNRYTTLTTGYNLSVDKIISILDKAGYTVSKSGLETEVKTYVDTLGGSYNTYKLSGADDYFSGKGSFVEGVRSFWDKTAATLLASRLATPIDVIMDAGYPEGVKNAMKSFATDVRPDVFVFLDKWYYGEDDVLTELKSTSDLSTMTLNPDNNNHNVALYDQWLRINDETFTDREICVTPSYFLSYLIPYNDINYGVQYPTAGLRRGILSDALYINDNPTPDEKNSLFDQRINYAEKTTREYAFMSQRTYDGSTDDDYTALSFINNTRTLFRMKRDIELLARNYLFEFNDSATLTNMSMVLNKYISEWVSNRTLSDAEITVNQNPVSEEAVDVTMNIKFTGTIEVISVNITIE